MEETERHCKAAEGRVNRTSKDFHEVKDDIDGALEKLQTTLNEYIEAIPDINDQVK